MPSISPRSVLIWISAFLLAFFLSIRVFNDGIPGWKHIVTSDGRGYYAYLPALILDRDPGFEKVTDREARLLGYPGYKPGYLVKAGEKNVNKYFAGEAVLLLPFFLTGTIFAWITGGEVDGYSFFFQFFSGVGALFYLIIGLWFLLRILTYLGIRQGPAALTLLIIITGTNLFYYSLWQPTMSHIYSFFAINGFCLQILMAFKGWNKRNAFLTGFFLAITLLIRPTNVVVLLLLPFFAVDWRELKRFFKEFFVQKLTSLLFIGTVLLFLSVQVWLWYIQTGQFALWPYRNEGFRFSSPEVFNVLFSFRKGLFVYTPLVLLVIPAWLALFFLNRLKFLSMTIFLVVSTYVIASWWCWYYGDGFGLRAFIDYYGIFAILIALLINRFSSKTGVAVTAVSLAPIVLLNFLQTWQYTHGVIQPNGMNEAKYRHVFLRTDSAVIKSLGGNDELADYTINLKRPVAVIASDFEQDRPNWYPNEIIELLGACSGSKAGYLDSAHQYSPNIMVNVSAFGKVPSSYYFEGELMIRDSMAGASNGSLVVLSIDSVSRGENWWQGFRINDVPQKFVATWSKRKFSLMSPVISNPRAILKVYIWNVGGKPLLVDDVTLRVYAHEDNLR